MFEKKIHNVNFGRPKINKKMQCMAICIMFFRLYKMETSSDQQENHFQIMKKLIVQRFFALMLLTFIYYLLIL